MKTIVHVINNLGRGGAETLLMDLLPELSKHYKIVLVTVEQGNDFGDAINTSCFEYYCLNHKGNIHYLPSVLKLSRIIKKHNPVLVRSQLVLSTIISRLACPSNIPIVFSIHNPISKDLGNGIAGKVTRLIEKATFKRSHAMIGVSQEAIADYLKNFSLPDKYYLLYNYVRDEFFASSLEREIKEKKLKLVSVGNLKPQKNYPYLIEAFKLLKDLDIQLDIYGDGWMYDQLKDQIDSFGLNICLKGKEKNISRVLYEYDAFILCSSYEGFGIVVAEAMAARKPLILSNLQVFKEVTHGNAFFIDLSSSNSLISLMKKLLNDRTFLKQHVETNRKIAEENYSQKVYLQKLLNIYEEVSNKGQKHN